MSLRRRTLLAIVFTFAGLLFLLILLSESIILNQFDHLQADSIQANLQRVVNTINKEIDTLNSVTSDWSYWDDTYQFVQDENADYITSNLTDDTFNNLHLNFMIFVNKEGKTVFAKAYAFETHTPSDLPADLNPQSGILKPFLNFPSAAEGNSGVLLSSQGPVLVASRTILTSLRSGTPQGVLIIGRYLDEQEVDAIAEQTQLTVKLLTYNSSEATPDFTTAQATLTASNAQYVSYVRKENVAQGFTLIKDFSGNPALILRIETPSQIYQAGEKAIGYFLIAMVVCGLTLNGFILWWIETKLLARLAFVDRRMFEIGNSDDLSARINLKGDDELARLVSTINASLAKREQSQEQKLLVLNTALQQANAALEEKINALKLNQMYKDRFFAHASHEFRTPLTIMATRFYLARKQPEQWETHLQVLEATHKRLLNVIDDIFEITRLQDNSISFNMRSMELNSFMTLILDDLVPLFKEKSATLVVNLLPEEIPVKIDAVLLGRAFEKLIGFMLDFSGSNIEIAVSLQKQTVDGAPVVCIQMSSMAFQFKPDEIAEMFSPFYQVSEGAFHSTGLNLAIAKQIIEIHQYTLTALVDEVRGGCFQIKIPLDSDPS